MHNNQLKHSSDQKLIEQLETIRGLIADRDWRSSQCQHCQAEIHQVPHLVL